MYKESADGFLAELKAECEALYGKNAGDTEYNDRVSTDPAIVRGEGGALTVDLAKANSPEVKMALNKVLGVHGIVIPEEIDREFYDKLMQMRGNTAARKNYLNSLRPRLSPEALRAAEMRLDSAIEHAEKLHSQGKVYGDEQWKNLNVLSSMSDLLPRQALAMHGTTDALAAVNEEVSGRLRPLAEKIDAFRQNPNATLAGLPNCVVMPHSSAFSPRYLERCFDELHAAGLLA